MYRRGRKKKVWRHLGEKYIKAANQSRFQIESGPPIIIPSFVEVFYEMLQNPIQLKV